MAGRGRGAAVAWVEDGAVSSRVRRGGAVGDQSGAGETEEERRDPQWAGGGRRTHTRCVTLGRLRGREWRAEGRGRGGSRGLLLVFQRGSG